MKCLPLVLLVCAAVTCSAQTPCPGTALSEAANRVHSLQEGLKRIQVGDMDI